MFTIDASYTSGTVTYLPTDNSAGMATGVDGLHGAAAIDAKGNLLTTQLKPGKLYSSEIGMNGSGSGKSTFIYDIPSVERYDGAACPYAPLMEKEASPRTVKAGEQLTYTYTVYNALVSQTMTYNFSDTLSDGRTFIGASLDNSYGGTANAYAGQANLSITGMSVPASSSIKFSVKVQIPSTASAKVMTNQAVASGFNIASFPAELKSDDPITVIFGDPTAVTVTALTAPGTPDTGIDFGSANTWVVVTILSALSAGLIWLGRKTTKLHTEH
jgi:uncharacterized repeat protein (TIGR01451 family)